MNIAETIGKAIIIIECISIGIWLLYVIFSKGKKPPQKIIKSAVLFALSAFFLVIINISPKQIDKIFLLEEHRPTYYKWLAQASSSFLETEGADSYVLTRVNKDGFGDVSSEDLKFYVKAMTHTYPEAKRMLLSFSDGTGIEIPENDLSAAVYGTQSVDGTVEEQKGIDVTLPLVTQIDGITYLRYEYDENNNPIHQKRLSADNITVADASGIAETFWEYDELKHITWEKRLGADGLPVLNPAGTAEFRRAYDGINLTEESFFDGQGNPVNLTDRLYSKRQLAYDEAGNCILEQYFDSEGSPVCSNSGYAEIKRAFDGKKHVIDEAYFDVDGSGKLMPNGYAEIKREYSGNDLVKEVYFDGQGNPVNRMDVLYSAIEIEYNENHNRVKEYYFNADGAPCLSNVGYASVKRSYDEGRLISESYYGADGNPITIRMGYSSITRVYDEAGNLVSEQYFDTTGAPADNINAYSLVENEFDENRNIVRQKFTDSEGQPVVTGSGYAEVRRKYDENNHLIQESYFSGNEEPYTQPAGYCAITQEWDGDILISRTYLGADGLPINRNDGYSKVVWMQGETCTEVHVYNTEGNEVDLSGINLARDIKCGSEGWSDWLMPTYNTVNSCQGIGSTTLGPKQDGDLYTCTLEIEYRGVAATPDQTIGFWAQGAQDGKWFTGNPWNSSLVSFNETPADGVYRYSSTVQITGDMVNVGNFGLGFRCDYWGNGMYRVRLVKVEKGDSPTDWDQGI